MAAAWGNVGRIAAKQAWASPVARSAIYGAGAGAAYGALSDNTSVLGGALAGAAIGGYGRRLAMTGAVRSGWNAGAGRWGGYGMFAGAGLGAGKAAARVAWSDARRAGRFIGSTATRAYNGFKGILGARALGARMF